MFDFWPVYSGERFRASWSSCLIISFANIEKASEISRKLILVGDLNEDLLNMNYHNLRDILLINSMQNVISDVTRQNAILDPIIIFDDVGCFGFNGPLRQYFSLYRAVSQREGAREEKG